MALPNETLAAILSELPPPSLAAVACVSVRFNAVAERILYASVYIAETLSESSPLPYRTLHWCEAMRRRPHLFDAARRLHIRWQSTSPPAPPAPTIPGSPYPPRRAQKPTVKVEPVPGRKDVLTVTVTPVEIFETAYYTTDGRKVTRNSPQYTGPFRVKPGTVVRVIAAAPAESPSPVQKQKVKL